MFKIYMKLFNTIWQYRELLWELIKRDIKDRYVGQALGVLWSIGHPLFLMSLYVFIFAFIFPSRMGGEYEFQGSYISFILSGLIPWLTFQEVMSRSVIVVISNASLVKQIVFPIELLPIKIVFGNFVSVFVALVILFFIQLYSNSIQWTWIYLPLLILFGYLPAMLGVTFILSALGTIFKDTKDFVQLFLSANLFLQPIFYLPHQIPESLKYFFYINPFSYQTWAFQDILFYGEFQHTWELSVYVLISWCILFLGYSIFMFARAKFTEVL